MTVAVIDIPVEIRVHRDGMPGDLEDFVIKTDRSSALTIVTYREPARVPKVIYSDIAGNQHGDGIPTEWAYQEASHNASLAARDAASETAARAALAELIASLGRLVYPVTVTIGDAAGETWDCRPGSVIPAGDREYADLRYHDPTWNVVIPCFPLRSA